ncbi:MAG: response regulator [Halobacteriovoraceae bacterium]|jgi:two-component system, chemotaxis family, chemotaxis protein CheY|nr:response regulator [Halobacteriovoraceae bacterium]MBT5093124.1 response regulator [Halobacteriovoraceae bacterium]
MKASDLKVLIVDDDSSSRNLLRQVLAKFSIEDISEADDGISAIELIDNFHGDEKAFDLILCDYMMANMDGQNFFDWVMRSQKCSSTQFIMVSSFDESSHIEAMGNSGITNYILKPLDPQVVWSKVSLVCGLE